MRFKKGLMKLLVSSLFVSSLVGITATEKIEAAIYTHSPTITSEHSGRMVAIVDMPAGTVDVGTVSAGSGSIVAQSYNKGTRQLTLTLENSSNTYVKGYTYGGELPIVTQGYTCRTYCGGYILAGWSDSYARSLAMVEVSTAYDGGAFSGWWPAYYLADYGDYGVSFSLNSNNPWKIEVKFKGYTTKTPAYGYQYPLSITYSTNQSPVLSVDDTSTIYSNKAAVDIRGKVSDPESNNSTVTVTVGGKSASGTVGGSTSPMGWLLRPILPEGRFSGGYVTAQDWESFASIVYLPEIIVDLTRPTTPQIEVGL